MDERIACVPDRRATVERRIVLVIACLAIANVVSNRILPTALYVPWNLAVGGAVLAVAWPVVSREELGMCEWRRGLRVGMVLVVATLVLLLIGLAMPAVNELFEDRRVSTGVATLLYQSIVRIPLGTVLLEEIAFRSVLPALVAIRLGILRGSIVASVLFGLWHVLPALDINTVNPVARDVFGSGAGGNFIAVMFAVLATTAAGLLLCLLRYRSRSILAPILAHVSTNSIGFTIAWFVAST